MGVRSCARKARLTVEVKERPEILREALARRTVGHEEGREGLVWASRPQISVRATAFAGKNDDE